MTLRTFHTGGVFTTSSTSPKLTFSTKKLSSSYFKFNSSSIFKLIKTKHPSSKLNYLARVPLYTKIPGQLKTKSNPLNIFTKSPRSIYYKLTNNTSYKLTLPKNINLYTTV